MDVRELFVDALDVGEGASEAAIAKLERRLGLMLPSDYAAFLRETDGVSGVVRSNLVNQSGRLVLWSTSVVGDLYINDDLEVQRYAPGLILFGSDGGNELFGFDARDEQLRVVNAYATDLDWDEVSEIAPCFAAFLEHLKFGR